MSLPEQAEMIDLLLRGWYEHPPTTRAAVRAAMAQLGALFDDVRAAVDPDYADARQGREPASQRN
jgi:hypothetical protein